MQIECSAACGRFELDDSIAGGGEQTFTVQVFGIREHLRDASVMHDDRRVRWLAADGCSLASGREFASSGGRRSSQSRIVRGMMALRAGLRPRRSTSFSGASSVWRRFGYGKIALERRAV